MKKLRVYLDTSVFGGVFDVEFAEASQRLFADIQLEKVIPLISETLITELENAPDRVRALLQEVLKRDAEILPMTVEAIELQDAYIKSEIVTPKYSTDALHVAQATIGRADVIVSWNYRHLVNPVRAIEFNGVNVANRHGVVVILSPSDLIKTLEAENE